MLPTISLGGVHLPGYTLMLLTALVAGGWVGSLQASRIGVDRRIAWDVLPFGAAGGIAGAVLYSLVTSGWQAGGLAAAFRGTGLVWYGGLAGGVAAGLWRARGWGIPLRTVLDGAAAPVALGYALGRVGCFLAGDDYGLPTALPWGVVFAQGAPPTTAENLRRLGADVPASVPADALLAVHPTQLYESAAALLIFLVCWRLFGRRLTPGLTAATFAVLLGLERFVVEFIRVKDDRWLHGLTTAQLISLVLIVAGGVVCTRLRPAARRSESPVIHRGDASRAPWA